MLDGLLGKQKEREKEREKRLGNLWHEGGMQGSGLPLPKFKYSESDF